MISSESLNARIARTEATWVKFGQLRDFVFVGGQTIATSSGLYVHFYDCKTKEKRIERFDGEERGDGASCLAGHSVVPIFSVVEKRANPKISVFAYPSLNKISSCTSDEETSGYLSCAFAGTDYLLGLASFPSFRMIVWQWKTGEKATAINTGIRDVDTQIIAASPGFPLAIAQFAPGTGNLSVYRLLVCSKIVRLYPLELTPPSKRKLVSFSWSFEGYLLLCDEFCDVWTVHVDTGKSGRIVTSTIERRSTRIPLLLAHRLGLLLVAPANDGLPSQATFYRKSADETGMEDWGAVWSISLPSHPTRLASHPRADRIIVHGETGEIYEIIPSPRESSAHLELLYTDGIKYEALSSVAGHARCLVVLDAFHRLTVLEATTGCQISSKIRLAHHGKVVRAIGHPTVPVIATISLTGNCLIVDLATPSAPKIIRCFHLQEEPLDRIKFSREGEILGLASSYLGRIFFLIANGERIRIAGLLDIEAQVVDFLIYERDGKPERGEKEEVSWRALVLAASPRARSAKNILVFSCVINCDDELRETLECTIELQRGFRELFYGLKDEGEIIGSPYLSKQLRRMKTSNWNDLTMVDALPSLHLSRNIGINACPTSSCVISYGHDGLIIVRDGVETRRVLEIVAAHHWSEAGIGSAAIVGQTIVSLGRNGDLIAGRLRRCFEEKSRIPSDRKTKLQKFWQVQEEIEVGKERGTESESWLNAMIEARARADREHFLPARLSILRDLKKLRDRIGRLVDANEREEPSHRLPISTFDIDEVSRRRKIEAANEKEERLRRDLEEQIERQERAASYLREKFWTPLRVRPCAISPFFSFGEADETVFNYSLTELGADRKTDARKWSEFSLEMEEHVSRLEQESDPTKQGDKNLWITRETTDNVCPEFSNEKEENDAAQLTWYQLLNPHRGYLDVLETNVILEDRELDVKVRFNELFEEVRAEKRNATKLMSELVERIRRCVEELRETFGPDSFDSETLTGIPFEAFPSEAFTSEEFTDRKSEASGNVEATDNNFRLKTLDKMMDGVLEVRWEDEIKRDIPKPECLVLRDSPRYTEEEIRKARESYEAKIRALNAERQKYKSALEAEITRSKGKLRESAITFNEKLKGLVRMKIDAERSILREKLGRIRGIVQHRMLAKGKRDIDRSREQEIASATREARELLEECTVFEATTNDLKNRYENLCKREKLLEGKFRSEFSTELKQPMIEHLLRHYKRRPRFDRGACTSVVYLTELARCTIANEESEILPRQCLEFLRAMEQLDEMPDGLPSQIERSHWRTMCKLRRVKAETEIKVRLGAIEVAEAEQSLAFYQKVSQAARAKANRYKETHRRFERSLLDLADDAEVRLVLKTGQLEVALRGSLADLESAILIRREEFVRVNAAIVRAGEQKLTALRRSIDLRNEIYREEWRHACAKTKMEHLQERLEELRGVKIPRILRECSSRSSRSTETAAKERAKRAETNLRAVENKLMGEIEQKKRRLQEVTREERKWKEISAKLIGQIEAQQEEKDRFLAETRDPLRRSRAELRGKILRMIRRRTNLTAKIRENFDDLLALRARLEILKLRTYPTLRFQP